VRGTYCYNGPQFDSVGQYKSCSVPGTIALTFDDGPSIYTSHILDVLKEHNMKATFFVIGKKIHDNHDIIQKIVDEGHQIGSHTYHHVDLNNISVCPDPYKEMIDWEIVFVKEKFTGVLANGVIPNYMRAPHGNLNNYTYNIVRNQLGYLPMHWGFLSSDTTGIQDSEVVQIYQSFLGGPSGIGVNTSAIDLIIQQHDTMQVTSDAFEDLTTYFEHVFVSKGIHFVTVSDCLGGVVPSFRQNPRSQSLQSGGSNNIDVSLITLVLCFFFYFF
jgi:peptidoglycan/xylan/chitin deacetylase (PgdA/CDA1 family)